MERERRKRRKREGRMKRSKEGKRAGRKERREGGRKEERGREGGKRCRDGQLIIIIISWCIGM